MSRLRTLWLALLMGAVMYAVVLQVLPRPPVAADPTMMTVMGLLALPLGLASQLVRRRLHQAAVDGLDPAALVDDGPDPDAAGAHFRDAGPRRRSARDAEALRQTAIRIYFRPFLVSCALADAVAVLGLLVGMFGGPQLLSIGLLGAGVVLLARLSPAQEEVFGPVERRLGIRLQDAPPST